MAWVYSHVFKVSGLFMGGGHDVLFYAAEQLGGEHEIVKSLIFGMKNLFFVAHPFAIAFVDEYDVLADTEHGVHVVGIYYRGDVVLMCYVAQQFVD